MDGDKPTAIKDNAPLLSDQPNTEPGNTESLIYNQNNDNNREPVTIASGSACSKENKVHDSLNERRLKSMLDEKEHEMNPDKINYLAYIHAECLKINGKYSKCDCCDYQIPKSNFKAFDENHYPTYYKYGIDLVNYFLFVDFYILLFQVYFLTYILEFIIALIINNFRLPYDDNFNIWYIEYYYHQTIHNENTFLKLIFIGLRIIIMITLITRLRKTLKITYKDYRRRLSIDFIDESIYSIFVKNIPILTEPDEFREHIEQKHPVKIKKMIFLKESEKHLELKYKLEELKTLKEEYCIQRNQQKETELTNLQKIYENEISENLERIEFSKTAILVFEKNEDKNYFMRRFFAFTDWGCKKVNKFRNKEYFVEVVPQLNTVNWYNIGVSLRKQLAYSNVVMVLTYLGITLLTFIILGIQIFITNLHNSINGTKIPFLDSVIMVAVNLIVELLFAIFIPFLRTQSHYFDHCILRLYVMHKTFVITVLIKLLNYNYDSRYIYTDSRNREFLIFIGLLIVKSFILTLFPGRYLKKLGVFYSKKIFSKKVFAQKNLNEAFEAPELDLMKMHENFRSMCLIGIFVLKLYPIIGIVLFGIIILYKYFLKWVIFNKTTLKTIIYYGYYFNLFLKMELMNLFFLNLALVDGIISANVSTILLFALLDLNLLFQFYFSYNAVYVEENHSVHEKKFANSFKDLDLVNELGMRVMINTKDFKA